MVLSVSRSFLPPLALPRRLLLPSCFCLAHATANASLLISPRPADILSILRFLEYRVEFAANLPVTFDPTFRPHLVDSSPLTFGGVVPRAPDETARSETLSKRRRPQFRIIKSCRAVLRRLIAIRIKSSSRFLLRIAVLRARVDSIDHSTFLSYTSLVYDFLIKYNSPSLFRKSSSVSLSRSSPSAYPPSRGRRSLETRVRVGNQPATESEMQFNIPLSRETLRTPRILYTRESRREYWPVERAASPGPTPVTFSRHIAGW